ncbi:MAG: lipid-binding protein [Bacteroidetes bacterium MedPE-SWsnd-G2]|nr:MAG: lipid-binding protein [Bacteroidetes bacterium MedPE-SWsnd-G2]
MKTNILKTAFALLFAITLASFTTLKDKAVKVADSEITWKGHKVTGEHSGTITLKEGKLTFEGDELKGGSFVMDMTTINTTDMEGEYKQKLDGHLKADDFFGVEKFPTASLKFTKVEGAGGTYKVTADLTIKGITNPVTFDLAVAGNTATSALKIDRTKYGIKYGSATFFDGIKDKAIYDEFDLNVNLKF